MSKRGHDVGTHGSMMGVALHPRDPDQVYGVTRCGQVLGTRDGGRSWRHAGLDATGRIARIVIDPANPDIVLACAAAGAKLILVMGHTSCGAIKGAIDGVELGHLTGLLNKIKPAVAATNYNGERSSGNAAFVDAVAATNVRRTVVDIGTRSSVLAGLVKDGKIDIVGSMYHLQGGRVEFFS